jgi:uracil-DNA glycosylase
MPVWLHPDRPLSILVLSINPRLNAASEIITDEAKYVLRATSAAAVHPNSKFDQALAQVLPPDHSFSAGNVASTRVYKCPTLKLTRQKGVAATCADRFLARELRLMRPRVILGMGVPVWPELFRWLKIAGDVPRGPGPHRAGAMIDGQAVQVVACYHLSGNAQARAPAYRAAVRRMLGDALSQSANRVSS